MRVLLLVALLAGAGVMLWALSTPAERMSPSEHFEFAIEAYDQGNLAPLYAAIHVLEDDPSYVEHLQVLIAVQAISDGRPDLALQRLMAMHQEGPLRAEILRFAGEALYRMQQLPNAEMVFRVLAAEQPQLASARRWLGAIYFDLGAYDAAIVELTSLVELCPDDYRAHRLLGLMYWDFERYSEASPHYQRVLELNPPDDVEAEVRVELARSLVALRRYDEALEILTVAPATPASQIVMAQCYWSNNRPEEARRLVTAAREIDSSSREAFLLEAEMLAAEADIDGAIRILQAGVERHPHDAECRYRLGLLLEQAGRADEAAIEMAIWEEKKNLATRLTELNIQAVQNPYNAEVRDDIAGICEALGRLELARVWREAAEACRAGAAMYPVEPNEPPS